MMKKILLLITTGCILFAAYGQAKDYPLPALLKKYQSNNALPLKSGVAGSYPCHTVEYNWTDDWVQYQTIETSYTTFGEPATIEVNHDGSLTRTLYSYNDQHLSTQILSQYKTGNNWFDNTRELYSYNSQGDETEYRSELWNGTAWEISSGSQYIYVMDGNRVSTLTTTDWNPETATWENSSRETYYYSGTSLEYNSMIAESWEKGAWINSYKYEFTWENNQISQALIYDYSNNSWTLTTKSVYEELENESFRTTNYAYLGPDSWMETIRNTVLFDSHGNMTSMTREMNMNGWTVVSAVQYLMTYDGDHLTQRITQTYYRLGQTPESAPLSIIWANNKKEVFSNFISMGTDVVLMPEEGVRVFPNPAGEQISVRIPSTNTSTVQLLIFSTNGVKVLDKEINGNGSDLIYLLTLDGMAKGTYVLSARDSKGTEIGKARFIKE